VNVTLQQDVIDKDAAIAARTGERDAARVSDAAKQAENDRLRQDVTDKDADIVTLTAERDTAVTNDALAVASNTLKQVDINRLTADVTRVEGERDAALANADAGLRAEIARVEGERDNAVASEARVQAEGVASTAAEKARADAALAELAAKDVIIAAAAASAQRILAKKAAAAGGPHPPITIAKLTEAASAWQAALALLDDDTNELEEYVARLHEGIVIATRADARRGMAGADGDQFHDLYLDTRGKVLVFHESVIRKAIKDLDSGREPEAIIRGMDKMQPMTDAVEKWGVAMDPNLMPAAVKEKAKALEAAAAAAAGGGGAPSGAVLTAAALAARKAAAIEAGGNAYLRARALAKTAHTRLPRLKQLRIYSASSGDADARAANVPTRELNAASQAAAAAMALAEAAGVEAEKMTNATQEQWPATLQAVQEALDKAEALEAAAGAALVAGELAVDAAKVAAAAAAAAAAGGGAGVRPVGIDDALWKKIEDGGKTVSDIQTADKTRYLYEGERGTRDNAYRTETEAKTAGYKKGDRVWYVGGKGVKRVEIRN